MSSKYVINSDREDMRGTFKGESQRPAEEKIPFSKERELESSALLQELPHTPIRW